MGGPGKAGIIQPISPISKSIITKTIIKSIFQKYEKKSR